MAQTARMRKTRLVVWPSLCITRIHRLVAFPPPFCLALSSFLCPLFLLFSSPLSFSLSLSPFPSPPSTVSNHDVYRLEARSHELDDDELLLVDSDDNELEPPDSPLPSPPARSRSQSVSGSASFAETGFHRLASTDEQPSEPAARSTTVRSPRRILVTAPSVCTNAADSTMRATPSSDNSSRYVTPVGLQVGLPGRP